MATHGASVTLALVNKAPRQIRLLAAQMTVLAAVHHFLGGPPAGTAEGAGHGEATGTVPQHREVLTQG